jgi:hypothetical protein
MTTLTVQEYEAAIFGDRFRKILDLINFLRSFDLSKLSDLVDAIKKVTDAPDLKAKVKAGLDALRIIAEMTPTDVDDRLVEMIDSVLTDEVLDIIVRLVSGMLSGGAQAQDVTIRAADRRTAAAAGIPWPFLVQIALQIVQLLENLGILSNETTPAPAE